MALARRLKRLSVEHENDVMMTQFVFFQSLARSLLNASLRQPTLL